MDLNKTLDTLQRHLQVPASVVWHVALRHNYLIAALDVIGLIVAASLLIATIGYIRKILHMDYDGPDQYGLGLTIGIVTIIGVGIWLICLAVDTCERTITPEYTTAQDILNSIPSVEAGK